MIQDSWHVIGSFPLVDMELSSFSSFPGVIKKPPPPPPQKSSDVLRSQKNHPYDTGKDSGQLVRYKDKNAGQKGSKKERKHKSRKDHKKAEIQGACLDDSSSSHKPKRLSSTASISADDPVSLLYQIDRSGDQDLYFFTTAHSNQPISYQRISSELLGIHSSIDPLQSTNYELPDRIYDKHQRFKLSMDPLNARSIKTIESIKQKNADFIALESVEFEAQQQSQLPVPSPPPIDPHAEIIQKQQKFNEQLASDPNNVPLWMKFIQFQVEFSSRTSGNNSRERHWQAFAKEKQLAIFEQAIGINPTSESLILAYVHLKTSDLDSDASLAVWKTLLEKHPSLHILKLHFCAFIQSFKSRFIYSECRDTYARMFSTLPNCADTAELQLHMFLRVVELDRQCGLTLSSSFNQC